MRRDRAIDGKVVTIVGARPQFIKAVVVGRVLREAHTEQDSGILVLFS